MQIIVSIVILVLGVVILGGLMKARKRHIKATPSEYSGSKPKGFKEGDTVTIYVNPEKPDRFILGKRMDAIDIIFGSIAIIMILGSAMAMIQTL